MRKYQWIVIITLIGCMVSFASCTKVRKKSTPIGSGVSDTGEVAPPMDVLIYIGSASWIILENATVEAKTTKKLLESNGIRAVITESEGSLKNWMVETTANGAVNVCILYGVLPASIYAAGNVQSDGSVAENWIETTDGDTILNHADYLGYYSSDGTPNNKAPLQNLMDLPHVDINVEEIENLNMLVTGDGKMVAPSLVNFKSNRPFPLEQLKAEWYAEKIYASDTGSIEATLADPIILRNGIHGRLAMVYQTHHGDNPKGQVAAEIIINYLLAK
ncbi:MAG: hypothetical protein OXD49_16300 [Candidatus Poribacteria bacterium]|nr:hypothetical protein [Candidatus Poribacteria bacterium]